MTIDDALTRKILILDGAMGTSLQGCYLTEEDYRRTPSGEAPLGDPVPELNGDCECLNLTRPDLIESIHDEFIEAGADIIESNTFSANRINQSLRGLGTRSYELALAGARIARSAADKANSAFASDPAFSGRHVFVAGSVGPTCYSLTLSAATAAESTPRYGFEDMCSAFQEQIEALIEGGSDLILFETFSDSRNAIAALTALERVRPGFPAIVSVLSDEDGMTLSGETLRGFYEAIKDFRLTAFGLNCSPGASPLSPHVKDLASWCPVPVIFYPDASEPGGLITYDDKPSHMAAHIRKLAVKGCLNIAGGCCGTTPEHICGIATALMDTDPRPLGQVTSENPAAAIPPVRKPSLPEIINSVRAEAKKEKPGKGPRIIQIMPGGHFHEADKIIERILLTSKGMDVCDLGYADVIDKTLDKAMAMGPSILRLYCQTPMSIFRAEAICKAMARRKLTLPLFVGGPAASPLATAFNLATVYPGAIYCGDAHSCLDMAGEYYACPEAFLESKAGEQEAIRKDFLEKRSGGVQLPGPKTVFKGNSYLKDPQARPKDLPLTEIPFDDIRSMVAVRQILRSCGVPSADDLNSPEARRMRKEIKLLLSEMAADKKIRIYAAARFYGACSDGTSISIDLEDGKSVSLPMLRQEEASKKRDGHQACLSIADFVPHVKHGFKGPVGFYCINLSGTCPKPSKSILPEDAFAVLYDSVKEALMSAAGHWLKLSVRKRIKRRRALCEMLAAGTAGCPDSGLASDIISLLPDAEGTGIELSGKRLKDPTKAECGIIIIHGQAKVPSIEKISESQFTHYCQFRGYTVSEADILMQIWR